MKTSSGFSSDRVKKTFEDHLKHGFRFAKFQLAYYEYTRGRSVAQNIEFVRTQNADPVNGVGKAFNDAGSEKLARLIVGNKLFPQWRGQSNFRSLKMEQWHDGDYVITHGGKIISPVISYKDAAVLYYAIRDRR